jgi:hypothetical protein
MLQSAAMPALGKGQVRVGVLVGRPVGRWVARMGRPDSSGGRGRSVVVPMAGIAARPVRAGGGPTRLAWSRLDGGVRWRCRWPVARPKWLVRAGGRCGGVRFSLDRGADAARVRWGSLTSVGAKAGSRKLTHFRQFLLLAHGS